MGELKSQSSLQSWIKIEIIKKRTTKERGKSTSRTIKEEKEKESSC
jgi:hypothetical protein